MQVLNKEAFDIMVFSNIVKVAYGENIKDYFMNDFRTSPETWDKVFKENQWNELGQAEKKEREVLIDQALVNFDFKRATFDL